jgi:hypothetical protein
MPSDRLDPYCKRQRSRASGTPLRCRRDRPLRRPHVRPAFHRALHGDGMMSRAILATGSAHSVACKAPLITQSVLPAPVPLSDLRAGKQRCCLRLLARWLGNPFKVRKRTPASLPMRDVQATRGMLPLWRSFAATATAKFANERQGLEIWIGRGWRAVPGVALTRRVGKSAAMQPGR